MPQDSKGPLPVNMGVRVVPDPEDESRRPVGHIMTGKIRISLTMPYFNTVKQAEEWIRNQIPNARKDHGRTYTVPGNVRIVVQVAQPAVKWE